jgi:hypothetical protein
MSWTRENEDASGNTYVDVIGVGQGITMMQVGTDTQR